MQAKQNNSLLVRDTSFNVLYPLLCEVISGLNPSPTVVASITTMSQVKQTFHKSTSIRNIFRRRSSASICFTLHFVTQILTLQVTNRTEDPSTCDFQMMKLLNSTCHFTSNYCLLQRWVVFLSSSRSPRTCRLERVSFLVFFAIIAIDSKAGPFMVPASIVRKTDSSICPSSTINCQLSPFTNCQSPVESRSSSVITVDTSFFTITDHSSTNMVHQVLVMKIR